MSDSPRDVICTVLPKSWSQTRRDAVADSITEALADAGMLLDGECTAVMVGDALLPVETVEAYGLTMKLDANGDASEISSRAGLVVLA